jgi:putative flippase GtrA
MLSARSLTQRLRRLAPEAMAFATIGAVNTMLYFAITWVALPIGAVKASVLATVITTTLAYFGNRYWTYRHHTRSALRREYTLFFGFNLVGMIIQSGAVTIGKYGFGLTEADDKLLILGCMAVGVAVGTLFRFWAYRTFVFLKKPHQRDTDDEAELTALDPAAGLAELSTERGTDGGTDLSGTDLDSEIAAEVAADRRHANR